MKTQTASPPRFTNELYAGPSFAGWGVYCGCESVVLDLPEAQARTLCALLNATVREYLGKDIKST